MNDTKVYLLHLILKHHHYYKIQNDTCIISGDYDNNYLVNTRATKAVCIDCDGKGTELIGGLKGHAFTESEREEMGQCEWDNLSQNMINGDYDKPCSKCKGKNVIDAPDLSSITIDQTEKLLKFFEENENEASVAYWESEGERRMGC